jgi:hypothetical protein
MTGSAQSSDSTSAEDEGSPHLRTARPFGPWISAWWRRPTSRQLASSTPDTSLKQEPIRMKKT